jgi:immune inhibitor A
MKRYSVIGLLALLLGLIAGVLPVGAAPGIDYRPVDVGPEIREWEPTQARLEGSPAAAEAEAEVGANAASSVDECILDEKDWLSMDSVAGSYFFTTFYLVAVGTDSELWVQADTSWPEGDTRETPEITCEQASYMVSEFDNNMLPKESDFFGVADFHDGSASLLEAWEIVPPGYYTDPDGKQVILVSNVRDENYYDPNYPLYIAGFYSPSLEAYFDRNVMTIDAYDWADRVGPDVERPHLYEGVFAHEYQHLLHDDYDPDEVNFVNEGLSMYAEYLTGYASGEEQYGGFLTNPENSLVVWEDQGNIEVLSDYGQAYLFQFYMMEQFGSAFLQAEFRNPENGISGINSTLDSRHIHRDFDDIYHDFSVAVLIDSRQNRYRYGFKKLDLAIDIGTVDDPNPEAYDMPGAPPWGTDYIWLYREPKKLGMFTFNGQDYSIFPSAWTSDGEVLWGGSGDLIDNWAIFEATGGGTLTFDTYVDIEDYWDFGFVQVSTDGGQTWTSLANEYTTSDHDPDAHPKVVENLPGLTGWSEDWITMSFDLSAYPGDILLAFRYITDWATTYDGWFIDNVYVDDVLISDGSDASVFKDITELFPIDNDFTVIFVGIRNLRGKPIYQVIKMRLNEETEEGFIQLRRLLGRSNKAVMLVTFDAPEGHSKYADYEYGFTYFDQGPRKPRFRNRHPWRRR